MGYLTNLQSKDGLFKFFGQLTPRITTDRPSLRRRRPLGIDSSKIGERITRLKSLSQSVGFMARCANLCRVITR
jgi:hypothetical protein